MLQTPFVNVWAYVEGSKATLLNFESENPVAELPVAQGTSVPDLPKTLRAVVALEDTALGASFLQIPLQPSSSTVLDSGKASFEEDSELDSGEPLSEHNALLDDLSEIFADTGWTVLDSSIPPRMLDSGDAPSKSAYASADFDNTYGYQRQSNGIYACNSSSGAVSYRVYGILGNSAPDWYACDANGNIFGIIREIPVIWSCVNYDKDLPGTYIFTAEFEGHAYSGPLPYIKVVLGTQPEIGGRLWLDKNVDGVMDEDETGVAHYPVSLYKADYFDSAVLTTQTAEDGTYAFANLDSGVYVVGIAAETVAQTEYQLPVSETSKDNDFAVQDEAPVAYSQGVTIAPMMRSMPVSLNAGVRALSTGEVVVTTAQQFIEAVNSNTVWRIIFADDILIEYGMTNGSGNWNQQYQSPAQPGYASQPQGILVGNKASAGGEGKFEIDGQGHKIIFNWPHTIVEMGNFFFPFSSAVTAFTMKDTTWYGSSEVGCYFPAGNTRSNVRITFDNVTYKGPGMGDIAIPTANNPQVFFKNCNITMSYRNSSSENGVDADGYGGNLPANGSAPHGALWQDTHASETIAANFVTFEGTNTITKQDSPANGGGVIGDIDPIFYIYWEGGSHIQVADDSSLIIYDEAGKTKQASYTTGLIGTFTGLYQTPFTVGKNATFEYHHFGGGNGYITDYYKLGSLTLKENANVVFDIKADTKFQTNDVSPNTAYLTVDAIEVGKGAKWTYVADYEGSAAAENNAMISTKSLNISEGAEVNIIAKNNTKATSLIILRGPTTPVISMDNPRNVLLLNSKADENAYVIRSNVNASLNIKANAIRSWRLAADAVTSKEINFGGQALLEDNHVVSPAATYQWELSGAQYTSTLNAGQGAAITNYTPEFGEFFDHMGTRTLQNTNILALRSEILPMDFIFYKENESHSALTGVEFVLYPQNDTETGWNMSGGISAISDAEGKVVFPQLNHGDYLLTEVKTAPGYMLPDGGWRVSVDPAAKSFSIAAIPANNGTLPPAFFTAEDGTTKLPNYRTIVLPQTGGPGSVLFVVAGVVLIGSACIFFILCRRSRATYTIGL